MTRQSDGTPHSPRRFHDTGLFEGGPHVTRQHTPHARNQFQPLPAPVGQPPYHLALGDVIPDQIKAIQVAGRLAFHITGDTGGVRRPEVQQIVETHMESDLQARIGHDLFDLTPGARPQGAAGAGGGGGRSRQGAVGATGVAGAATAPSFFYHLGDVVYYYGQADQYYSQFYEPYVHYGAPIFAIPGNHDGDIDPTSSAVPSLDAFMRNFCAREAGYTPEVGDAYRQAMTQPNTYWTLEAPFVTIIGLYTNVPEGGQMDSTQIQWFHEELRNAPTDKALIVAMHHPIYSLDNHHSGSAYMEGKLDEAMKSTGRIPDAVFAGHVHNYQRFTHQLGGREVPYVVAGAGGYWNLHYIAKGPNGPVETPLQFPGRELTLETYVDDRHGYLLLEVTPTTMTGRYFTVPRPQESWRSPARREDLFTLDLKTHKLVLQR